MKQTLNFYGFCDSFISAGRYDQFGLAGLELLFDYLEELEKDLGQEFELDVMTYDEYVAEYLDGDDMEKLSSYDDRNAALSDLFLQNHDRVLQFTNDLILVDNNR